MTDSTQQSTAKRPYQTPLMDCYGPISNFTTGGSSKRTEWMYNDSAGMWSQNMSKKKNVVKS